MVYFKKRERWWHFINFDLCEYITCSKQNAIKTVAKTVTARSSKTGVAPPGLQTPTPKELRGGSISASGQTQTAPPRPHSPLYKQAICYPSCPHHSVAVKLKLTGSSHGPSIGAPSLLDRNKDALKNSISKLYVYFPNGKIQALKWKKKKKNLCTKDVLHNVI